MPKNINSASRLHSLLEKALNEPDSTQVVEAWAKLFAINEPNGNLKAALVSQRLLLVHKELELISAQMKELNYSETLYTNAISNVEYAISTMILPNTWNNAKQYLRPEYLTALAFCSEMLPDEESQISLDDLEKIQEIVNELRESIFKSELPPRLIKLIKHHIELIEQALAEYPIAGVKALQKAWHKGLGEIIESKDDVSANKNSPEIKKLHLVWEKINNSIDAAEKIQRIANITEKAITFIGNVF